MPLPIVWPTLASASKRWDECCGHLSGANGALSNIFSAINRTYILEQSSTPC